MKALGKPMEAIRAKHKIEMAGLLGYYVTITYHSKEQSCNITDAEEMEDSE